RPGYGEGLGVGVGVGEPAGVGLGVGVGGGPGGGGAVGGGGGGGGGIDGIFTWTVTVAWSALTPGGSTRRTVSSVSPVRPTWVRGGGPTASSPLRRSSGPVSCTVGGSTVMPVR